MTRKLNHVVEAARLLGIVFILLVKTAFAEPSPPAVEEVLGVLGMNKVQIAELAQGQPVAYALSEASADELAMGVVWYLPVPLPKVAGHLRLENPDPLDVDVTAHGMLTEHGGAGSLAPVILSEELAQALLAAEPGDEFNLSIHEIDSFNALKKTLKLKTSRATREAVGQHYREMLFQRFKAYQGGGTNAIAPYAREENLNSKPSMELRQAAHESAILERYFPVLRKAWLDYPKALPPGAAESFPWLEKKVQNQSAVILRHRVNIDWDGGILVLTREFYAQHSFNSSQWITGCLAYRDGTVIFQQVRSYTDQVTGVASAVKHIVGRELLKDKMLKFFKHLCTVMDQCY